jgi:two-component system OmpR family sensor kinase
LALERNIELSLHATPRLQVRADHEALRILVRNLVDNAVRYTPSGGTVQVSCAASEDGGAVLEVVDSGPGIAAADRDRAFDRFYRLSSQQIGTGLGLAIVKAIAERHGATVALDAAAPGAPLCGLRVRVHFPPAP